MLSITEFFRSNGYLIFSNIIILFLFIFSIVLSYLYFNMFKKYNNFIKKLGNSKNIEEDLENYIYKVDRVSKENADIKLQFKNIEMDLQKCIKKVGIVRYSAFKDIGSDLSFAVALLDEKNDGVVLNGIYSREMSNTYAKAIKNGMSNHTLSNEEKEAINKAINSNNICVEKII